MRNHWKQDIGHSLIEFTIVSLILLLIFMGVFDFGRAVCIYSVISASAQEGARYGIVHPTDIAGIESAVRSRAVGLDPSLMDIVISYPDSSTVEVRVSYDFVALSPLIGGLVGDDGQLTLTSTARMAF